MGNDASRTHTVDPDPGSGVIAEIISSDTIVTHFTEFKIKAHTSDPTVFYESGIATGYSLDNPIARNYHC